MAVVLNPNDPNAVKKQTDEQGQPLQTIGTATPATPAAAGNKSVAPAARPTPQGSGRFTNIQKYVQANQGGGQKIADGIQNQFQKQTQSLGEGINYSQQRLNTNAGQLNNQLGQQGSQVIAGSFQDPQAILENQRKLVEARNMQKGLGQNIANVDGVEALRQQQLQGQLAQAQKTASLAGTEQGRFEMLRNMLAKNNTGYSQGSQRLDQVLLQSQPDVAQNLQTGLQGIINPNQQNLSNLQSSRQQQINDLRGLSNDRKNQWSGLLNEGVAAGETPEEALNQRGLTDMERSSDARLKVAERERDTLVPELRTALTANKLTTEQMNRLGLTGGTQLYDVDPNAYMSQTDYNPDINTAADPNEVKRYNALRKLASMGAGGKFAADAETTAGTYKPFEFDKAKFGEATVAAKKKFEVDNVNNLISYMDQRNLTNGHNGGHLVDPRYSNNAGGWAYDPTKTASLGGKLAMLKSEVESGKIPQDEYYQRIKQAVNDNFKGVEYARKRHDDTDAYAGPDWRDLHSWNENDGRTGALKYDNNNRMWYRPGQTMGDNAFDSFGGSVDGYKQLLEYAANLNTNRNRVLNATDATTPAPQYGNVLMPLAPNTNPMTPKLGAEGTTTPLIDPKSLSK